MFHFSHSVLKNSDKKFIFSSFNPFIPCNLSGEYLITSTVSSLNSSTIFLAVFLPIPFILSDIYCINVALSFGITLEYVENLNCSP
ncbi:hypothetical protein D3C73_1182020 [compost metagenome]